MKTNKISNFMNNANEVKEHTKQALQRIAHCYDTGLQMILLMPKEIFSAPGINKWIIGEIRIRQDETALPRHLIQHV
jgi:hypothetical protein